MTVLVSKEKLEYFKTRCRRYPRFLPKDFRKRVRTVFPYFFMPDVYFDNPHSGWDDIIVHESVHLPQESKGPRWVPVFFRLIWFLISYADKKKRLFIEASAVAVEIINTEDDAAKQILFDDYCKALVGDDYAHAASDIEEARNAILQYLLEYQGKAENAWLPKRSDHAILAGILL